MRYRPFQHWFKLGMCLIVACYSINISTATQLCYRASLHHTPWRPRSKTTSHPPIDRHHLIPHDRPRNHKQPHRVRGSLLPHRRRDRDTPNPHAPRRGPRPARAARIRALDRALRPPLRRAHRTGARGCRRAVRNLACRVLRRDRRAVRHPRDAILVAARLPREEQGRDVLRDPVQHGPVRGHGATARPGGPDHDRVERDVHQLVGHADVPPRRTSVPLLDVRPPLFSICLSLIHLTALSSDCSVSWAWSASRWHRSSDAPSTASCPGPQPSSRHSHCLPRSRYKPPQSG